jgi:rubrerythrin
MNKTCVHSCKGLCNALEIAEHREREAIKTYREFVDNCDYPDVREVMKALIEERERGLKLLQEKREILMVRFNTIDRINESFW